MATRGPPQGHINRKLYGALSVSGILGDDLLELCVIRENKAINEFGLIRSDNYLLPK